MLGSAHAVAASSRAVFGGRAVAGSVAHFLGEFQGVGLLNDLLGCACRNWSRIYPQMFNRPPP